MMMTPDDEVWQSGAVSRTSELRAIVVVAIGGVVGSSARWFVGTLLGGRAPEGIPWPTLAVNVIGCLLIGIASRRIERNTTSWSFVATGVLGGFTTMSALAVELDRFADTGRTGVAAGYLGLTFTAGLVSVLIGERVGQRAVPPDAAP
jgi:fluoride exporter